MSGPPYPPIEQMLPHRAPFLFIRSICELFEDRIVCHGVIEKGHYLTLGEEAPPILGIEMGAQASGIHAAQQNRDTGPTNSPARVGYLVGIRQSRFHVKALPVGRTLRVEAIAHGASGPLATYGILVRAEGEEDLMVEARISTWAADQAG
jgi:predicted hotdog family 3-hydroxylacyl-ACP dehydratase